VTQYVRIPGTQYLILCQGETPAEKTKKPPYRHLADRAV